MSFGNTTKNIRLGGSTLYADCLDNDGNWVSSQLDLDTCLGNIDGNFQWDKQAFSASAEDVKLKFTVVNLTASLEKADGDSFSSSTVNLNDRISNNNGKLTFN
jgi:hypothetical protein